MPIFVYTNMRYQIDIWGIDGNDKKFDESLICKSDKRKNWVKKMRELHGGKINFDSLKEFHW